VHNTIAQHLHNTRHISHAHMFYPKYLCCVLYKNIFFNWRWWFGLFVGRYGDDWCIVNKRVWHMTSYMLICKDMNIISKLSLFSFWMCLIYFKNFSSSLFPYNFITRNDIYYTLSYFVNVTLLISFFFFKKKIIIKKKID